MEKGFAKRLNRYHWLRLVRDGAITLVEASMQMGVSYRQAKRLKRAFTSGGIEALAHGNRGRPPANKTDQQIRSSSRRTKRLCNRLAYTWPESER